MIFSGTVAAYSTRFHSLSDCDHATSARVLALLLLLSFADADVACAGRLVNFEVEVSLDRTVVIEVDANATVLDMIHAIKSKVRGWRVTTLALVLLRRC